jgi:tRNA-dihydrouridine synthase
VALDIVRRTRDAVPPNIPVTLKMRRGIDDSAESRENFFTILDGAFAAGVAAITVHGRTVKQRYIGPSRWEFLTEVKRHAGERTIFGSGDLFSAADCLRMLQETGVDGVTIARGAIGNPWIFAEAQALLEGRPLPPPPSVFQQRDVIREHFRLSEELYGVDRAALHMRKFCIKYSALHPEHHEVRESLVRVRSRDEWEGVLTRFYAEDLAGCQPGPEIHKAQGSCGTCWTSVAGAVSEQSPARTSL